MTEQRGDAPTSASPGARAGLKLFLGYAPGVGKTRALLEDGRRLRDGGFDVVVGFVNTRGRTGTGELLEGLEVLTGTSIANARPSRAGLDLDAALARRPGTLLVDDIERPNGPGSRHARCWQDLVELLDAGIAVHATLDVFRLESLNDVVLQIAGVRVEDTVPDSILERADEIVLVDVPPRELAARVATAGAEADPLLQPGALLALRELALRRTAERVDSDIRSYRREHGIGTWWPTSERILACVGSSPSSARVVRAAMRVAEELHAPWAAAYVEASDARPMRGEDRERLQAHLRLAESLGGEVVRLAGRRVSEELLRCARERNVTRIVVGRPTHSRLRDVVRRSLVDALVVGSSGIEVHVIAGEKEPRAHVRAGRSTRRVEVTGFLLALALVAAVTLAASFVRAFLPETEIVMSYLLVIMVVAFAYGRGPALAAAGLAVAAYDFFFVPPVLRFTVADARHLLTFAMMFGVGLAISSLTGRLRRQGHEARLRERRTAGLYALVRELAASTDEEQAAGIAARHAAGAIGGEAAVLLRDPAGHLRVAGVSDRGVRLGTEETAIAGWVGDNGRPAGRGTETHAGAAVVCVPVATGQTVLGVLAMRPSGRLPPDAEERSFLEAFVRQVALTIERARLGGEARAAAVRARAEETRTSLLSAVSHDLRTPLAAITGAGTALRMDQGRLGADQQKELLDTICDEAGRMDRLIGNILDMVRLEAGGPAARREWVPLEEVIGPALARLEDRLTGRDVRVDLPADFPLLPVDPVLFEHLLFNLIENAAKHTSSPVSIEVHARAGDGWVEIEVADRGPGLPPGEEQRVFEKFYRGPAARGPGMGLGLAICRSIAQIHDGSLAGENRPGGGAVFRIRLPIPERPPETGPLIVPAADGNNPLG
jgi:two-component system sensor histidine kinase KdpD